MRISIIIPTYNEELDILNCLFHIIAQKTLPYEIIIVDSSIDRTPQILKELSEKSPIPNLIKYRFIPKSNPATARNYGVSVSEGDVILFVDSDQLLIDTYITTKISEVFENQAINCAYFYGIEKEDRTFIQKALIVRSYLSRIHRKQMDNKGFRYVNCIRKSIFLKEGGFNEQLDYYEDKEFGNRIKQKYIITPIQTEIIHKEPSTLTELYNQTKWIGNALGKMKLEPLRKYALNKSIIFAFLIVALSIIYSFPLQSTHEGIKILQISFDPVKILLLLMLSWALLGWVNLKEHYKKNWLSFLFPSIIWVFIIYPIRIALIGFFAFKKLMEGR